MSASTSSKIAKMIPRLASGHDGEVIATRDAIDRSLRAVGHDWHDLAKAYNQMAVLHIARRAPPPAPPPSMGFGDIARYCRDHDRGQLRDAERRFVADMVRRGFNWSPSQKQIAWLDAIFSRLQREAA